MVEYVTIEAGKNGHSKEKERGGLYSLHNGFILFFHRLRVLSQLLTKCF